MLSEVRYLLVRNGRILPFFKRNLAKFKVAQICIKKGNLEIYFYLRKLLRFKGQFSKKVKKNIFLDPFLFNFVRPTLIMSIAGLEREGYKTNVKNTTANLDVHTVLMRGKTSDLF